MRWVHKLSPLPSGLWRQAPTCRGPGAVQARQAAEQAHTGSPSCPAAPLRGGGPGWVPGGRAFLGRQPGQGRPQLHSLPREGVGTVLPGALASGLLLAPLADIGAS